MKTLITGAEGQLGRSFRGILPKDSLVALNHTDLEITDLEQVRAAIKRHKPDLVINAAAYNQVDLAETETDLAFQVNAEGPKNLSVVSAEEKATFVHVSTDYVFDGTKKSPYVETDEPKPLSAYGRSKLKGEETTLQNNPQSFVVRTSWVYHEIGGYFLKMMHDKRNDPNLRIVSDQFSAPTYAPHLAKAILEMVKTKNYGVYHLAGSGETSRYGMLKEFFELLGIGINFKPVSKEEFNEVAARPTYSVLGTNQNPRIVLPPWQEGMRIFAENMKKVLS